MSDLEKALGLGPNGFALRSAGNSPSIPTEPTPSIGAIGSSWWSKPGWPTAFRAETGELFDDYRFWRERDPELKSLAVSDPENPDC